MTHSHPSRARCTALIPAYFEARHIGEVVRRTAQQVDHVLVVDDGSTDATAAEARAGGAEVLRHLTNHGKGAAIKTGLSHLLERSGLEYVVLLDGDGQHLPEEIPHFLAAAGESRAGLLVGNRMSDAAKMPLVRRLTNLSMSWQISRLCGQAIPDTQCGFRLLRRELLRPLIDAPSDNYDFETEMLVIASRRGHGIGAVPVSTVYGEEKSKIRPVRDTIRFFKLLRRLRQPDATSAFPAASGVQLSH